MATVVRLQPTLFHQNLNFFIYINIQRLIKTNYYLNLHLYNTHLNITHMYLLWYNFNIIYYESKLIFIN